MELMYLHYIKHIFEWPTANYRHSVLFIWTKNFVNFLANIALGRKVQENMSVLENKEIFNFNGDERKCKLAPRDSHWPNLG